MINANKDTASLWQAINEITHKSRKKEMSHYPWSPDSFNDHFVNIVESMLEGNTAFTKENRTFPSVMKLCEDKIKHEDSFEIPLLAVHEVGALITSRKNKKAMGPDNLNPTLLKIALPYIVEALTFIYNKCIENGMFPPPLKSAKVIPLPKSKVITDMNNFRPISLLSVLSKPLEKHVHKHLMQYLERNNLIYDFQSGFRRNHSCQTALIRMCDTWLSAINRNNIVGAVFLDFRKAFDCVDHNILISKLTSYLKNKLTISFFKSFLSNRTQRVFTNGMYSAPKEIKYGVPQGSILGPLLFCLFINDLPLSLSDRKVSCDIFADDTSLHCNAAKITEVQNALQNSLNEVLNWCHLNNMVLHPEKTKSMALSSRQKHQRNDFTLHLSLNKKKH